MYTKVGWWPWATKALNMNDAWIMKLAWRLCDEPEALWSQILCSKYKGGEDIINVRQRVCSRWEIYERNIYWRIGDGSVLRPPLPQPHQRCHLHQQTARSCLCQATTLSNSETPSANTNTQFKMAMLDFNWVSCVQFSPNNPQHTIVFASGSAADEKHVSGLRGADFLSLSLMLRWCFSCTLQRPLIPPKPFTEVISNLTFTPQNNSYKCHIRG
ncbi:hypothetical protein RJT34_14341 [Clitoria ternatea]|uniref:Uncharacterized protein n=1 Tax=Clitoria ternatea TaxID=43366 RepID=A0AAN9JQ80_CLITE